MKKQKSILQVSRFCSYRLDIDMICLMYKSYLEDERGWQSGSEEKMINEEIEREREREKMRQ